MGTGESGRGAAGRDGSVAGMPCLREAATKFFGFRGAYDSRRQGLRAVWEVTGAATAAAAATVAADLAAAAALVAAVLRCTGRCTASQGFGDRGSRARGVKVCGPSGVGLTRLLGCV